MKTFILVLAAALTIPTGAPTDWDSLIDTVTQTPITSLNTEAPYDRETQFGPAWKDIDHNGCDTRNDILARDLANVEWKSNGCQVATGTLEKDMYSGSTIEFVRGQGNCTRTLGTWNGKAVEHKRLGPSGDGGCSEAIQIDHVVPLALAWRNGADTWTQEEREQFANDPINLVASDGALNQLKSDKGPSQWLPDPQAGGDTCAYVARYANVYGHYRLTITQADKEALVTNLQACRDTGVAPALVPVVNEEKGRVPWQVVAGALVVAVALQLWRKAHRQRR